jgi:protein toll
MVRAEDRTLIMDCSNAGLEKIPVIPNAKDIRNVELNIENNNITQLVNASELGFDNVSMILASGNQIKEVHPSQIPESLQALQLHDNQIERINQTVFKSIKSISLRNNPLICDCKTTELLGFITQNRKNFSDYNEITCAGRKVFFSQATSDDICSTNKVIYIAAGSILALLGLIVGGCAAFYYKYNHEIKVWLYAHNWCLWFVTEDEVDKDLQYDAFISYSHKDEDFVVEHLVPELEHGTLPYKLCLHIRDWVVGDWIPTQVSFIMTF